MLGTLGPHASAHAVFGSFEDPGFAPHGRLFGGSIGIVTRAFRQWPAPTTVRFDYIHFFGGGPRSDGVTLGFDVLLL